MAALRSVAGALALLGCTSSGSSASGTPPPTAILVEPATFLGAVPCLDAPGAMRRYVATLLDVSPPPRDAMAHDDIVLPSSGPTACHLDVRFTLVAPGRRYVTEIDGYDRTDLTPVVPGSRIMLDPDGNVVTPRWTTACGRDLDPVTDGGADPASPDAGSDASGPDLTGPVYAGFELTVPIRGCRPLRDAQEATGATAIVLDPSRALPDGRCPTTDGGGAIEMSVTLLETGEQRRTPCDQPLVFSGLTDAVEYHFDLEAPDSTTDGGVRHAQCFRVAREGLTLTAACDPLGA
jgi:hypothetical protein